MKAITKTMIVLSLISCFFIGCLWAQDYPEIFYLAGFDMYNSGGTFSGPDWSSHDIVGYVCSDVSPLHIIGVSYEHFFSDGFGNDHSSSYADFDGSVEFLPEYFIVRSPLNLGISLMRYRISKIAYNGYYQEDCLSFSADGTDYLLKAWHVYDTDMKLASTIVKYANPLRWVRTTTTRDNLGRRIEDVDYTSQDSTKWYESQKVHYTYADAPYPQPYQFEKYENYLPGFIVYRYPQFFMDNDYPISSVTILTANPDGGWYQPVTYQLQYTISANQISSEYLSWDNHGLLTFSGREEIPSYYFHYANSTSADDPSAPPISDSSFGIYPNPIQAHAKLSYSIPKVSSVKLSTYNLRGQLVKTDSFVAHDRSGTLDWEPIDTAGRALKNGVYLLRFQSDGVSETKRIVVWH